jgi:L-rhamnose mutarotase
MRYAFHLTIRNEYMEEYDRRHASVWDEMKSMLKEAGVKNYSIFRDGIHVFGYWECENLENTLKHINESIINSRWQEYMNDVILGDPEERTSGGMAEVFHLD